MLSGFAFFLRSFIDLFWGEACGERTERNRTDSIVSHSLLICLGREFTPHTFRKVKVFIFSC